MFFHELRRIFITAFVILIIVVVTGSVSIAVEAVLEPEPPKVDMAEAPALCIGRLSGIVGGKRDDLAEGFVTRWRGRSLLFAARPPRGRVDVLDVPSLQVCGRALAPIARAGDVTFFEVSAKLLRPLGLAVTDPRCGDAVYVLCEPWGGPIGMKPMVYGGRVVRVGPELSVKWRLPDGAGALLLTRARGAPVLNDDGKVVGVHVSATDERYGALGTVVPVSRLREALTARFGPDAPP
jgi:hypothetical protein